MKKVLIITYYFPPRQAIGSVRLGGLAKYLPEFGWQPTIITPALPSVSDKKFQVIETFYPGDVITRIKKRLSLNANIGLQKQLGIPLALREGKNSISNKILAFIQSIISYPDEQIGWYPYATKAGEELLGNLNFDAIISSSSPVTTHLVAKHLKEKRNIPWVADLRDLWTQNHYHIYVPVRKWFEKRLELRTLNWADALVTVSQPLVDKLCTLHRNKTVRCILNGFDPDELSVAPLTKEFTITYTGHLYEGKRDPYVILKAIQSLVAESKIDAGEIRIRFFGQTQYWLEREFASLNLKGIAAQYGIVSRDVVLVKQRESHILLLLNWDNPGDQGVYPAKVFEYLAAKRPIVAIGGKGGVVKGLLEATNAGIHSSNLEDTKKIILDYYREYKTTGIVSYKGNEMMILKYNHIEMARKFANVLDEVSKK